MNCDNCQSEMEKVIGVNRVEDAVTYSIFWCRDCGSIYDEEEDKWLIPNSANNTKILVAELIKARNRATNHARTINKMIDEQREEVGWEDRDR